MKKIAKFGVSAAAFVSLAACGGGGGDKSGSVANSGSQPPSTMKLADPANNYATSKKATGYVLFAARDVYQLYLHTLATVLTGANQSSAGKHTHNCPGGGSATVTLNDSDNSHSITRGDSAVIEFADCRQFGTVEGQALESINGGMSFAMNMVEGIIGSTGDYGFAADVTASALAFATNTAKGSIDGAMALTGKHTSSGIDSAVATTSSVTVKRTVNGRTDSITLVDWTERDDYSAQTNTDKVSVDGKLNVTSPDGDASFLVNTPTPIVATNGNSLDSGNLTIATTVDTVTATFAGNSNVTLALDAGKTGTPTAVVPTSIDEINALLKS